jgi:hypothetical protein
MTRESPQARAERILAELRAATSEAAGVMKDLTGVIKGARVEVEQYLHDECQRALNENTDNMLAEVQRVTKQTYDRVVTVTTGWVGAVENQITRDRLIQAAAEQIAGEVLARFAQAGIDPRITAPAITISVCDRPHAD